MDLRTRVLAVDFSLAGGAASVGALGAGGPLAWNLLVMLVGSGVLVAGLYLAEQTPLLDLVETHSPTSHAVAFVVPLAVGVVLVLGWTVVVSPAATLLLGMGTGLAGYRFVYGVLEPIPEKRLAQARYPDELDVRPPP